MKSQLHQIHQDLMSRAKRIRVPSNPPSLNNAGDVWHSRTVGTTTLADASGNSVLTAGKILLALSANAGNIPVRITSIKGWAVAGTAGTYPPTFLQVDFANEEFMQTQPGAASARDSLFDAGGQGAGCAGIGLYIPDSQRLTRSDWATGSNTVVATATGLSSGARILWHINLQFKF
jgi:hypothetical protein